MIHLRPHETPYLGVHQTGSSSVCFPTFPREVVQVAQIVRLSFCADRFYEGDFSSGRTSRLSVSPFALFKQRCFHGMDTIVHLVSESIADIGKWVGAKIQMRRAKRSLTCCAFTMLIWVCSALAQPMGPPPGVSDGKVAAPDPLVAAASRWDANHDGIFTCEEWKQYADRLFTMADKNSDGFLDAKEFQQLGKIDPIFSGADIGYFDDNRDQRVSCKEFTNKPNPLFAKYDANGDCRVTSEELKRSTTINRGNPKGGPPNGSAPSGMGRGHF